jgi:hypothetical protein
VTTVTAGDFRLGELRASSYPLLLFALNACRNDDRPGAAPPSPSATTSKTQTPPHTARRPRLAGPDTKCGEVQPLGGGPAAAVGVLMGHVACSTAMAVFHTRGTPKQGSAGVATAGGRRYASNSAAHANLTGRLSTCQRSATEITADVIP